MRFLNPTPRSALGRADVLVGSFLLVMLLSLSLPACRRLHRDDGVRFQTTSNLKQLGLAIHAYNDVYKRLPPAYDVAGSLRFPASMHVHLLPYIEQDALYQLFAKGGQVPPAIIPPFVAPGDSTNGDGTDVQNFAGNLRVFSTRDVKTKFDQSIPAPGETDPSDSSIPNTFTDGVSNTLAFATKLAVCGMGGSKYRASPHSLFGAYFGDNPATKSAHASDRDAMFQTAPTQRNCLASPFMAQSFDVYGLRVALADASVRSINPKMSPETWNRAMQPNDGKTMPDDWNP